MKDTIDSIPAERPVEQEAFANRKLIRPLLNRNDHNHTQTSIDRRERPERSPLAGKKIPPPETTNAENFYYVKQMQSKTQMVVVLTDGEQIRGIIEWYDKNCIKVHRTEGPNLLVYKPSIKYLYKQNEAGERG